MSELVRALWRLLSGEPQAPLVTAVPSRDEAALHRAVARAHELERMLRDARGALLAERARRAQLSRQLSAAKRRLQVVRDYSARVAGATDVVVRVRSADRKAIARVPPHRPELVRFRLPPSIIDG